MNTLIKINFFLFALLFLITAIKWADNYLQKNGIETGLVWGILICLVPILALVMKSGDYGK